MTTDAPLIFRPSPFHRLFAILLCIGSWMTGIRGLAVIIECVPKFMVNVQRARLAGESTFILWVCIVVFAVGCLLSGVFWVASILVLMIIEGTNITVDKIGINVEYELFPSRMATYFGAGYMPWNRVVRIEKHGVFFVLYGEQLSANSGSVDLTYKFRSSVKFIIVQELDRLVLTIIKCSDNITFL